MVLGEVSENVSISPGSEIYAEVVDITDSTAMLTQKRGIYRRNHHPGDPIRVQGVEQVNSAVCKAELEHPRNLDTVYVIGISVCADVTAELAKIRDRTAFAFPVTVHDPGPSSNIPYIACPKLDTFSLLQTPIREQT